MKSLLHGSALFLLLPLAWVKPALAEDNPAVVETLAILKERGMIDEAKYAELTAKNQAWEASHPSLLSRLEWSADFRGRLENFWYQDDPFGVDTPDNNRGRYRLRIGARAKVNEVVTAGFRLGSGDNNGFRSENRSLGKSDNFDYDPIFIDQAYAELAVPKRFLAEGMTVKTIVGKQQNPFLWKNGKDIMIWDNDITPEGAGFQLTALPTDRVNVFVNAGYFISDQNDATSDPHVLGLQGGFGYSPFESVDTGMRASWYSWGSQGGDANFETTEASFGNLTPNDFSVLETSAYVRFKQIQGWPILLSAGIAQNISAENVAGAGKQDVGWNAGLEVGDKKRVALFGLGYYHEEANFAPAQFTDSDLFDGYTNRKGWMFYAQRQLLENTDVQVTFFKDDPIETSDAFAIPGASSSDRYRLMTDLVVAF